MTKTKKKCVLITRADGQIGTALREYLVDRFDLVCLTHSPEDARIALTRHYPAVHLGINLVSATNTGFW